MLRFRYRGWPLEIERCPDEEGYWLDKDEEKHIRWCDPVVEHFARDAAELRRERLRFRRIARLAYHRHNLLGADLSLIHIPEPTRRYATSDAVLFLKNKTTQNDFSYNIQYYLRIET